MILYISDFDLRGSGYMNISTHLCNELVVNHNYGLVALGLGYRGQQHDWPYTITPIQTFPELAVSIKAILETGAPVEAIVVALDISLQEKLVPFVNQLQIPYIAIFPLEAPPLCSRWALAMYSMTERLVMSHFGVEELKKQGVDSTFIPIPVGDIWKPIKPVERELLRKAMGYDKYTRVFLTIADNQERKNLSKTAEIISFLAGDSIEYNEMGYGTLVNAKDDIVWNLVTRINSPVGWDLNDLLARNGISGITNLFDRGMKNEELLDLMLVSDAFLLTSKAEGLALPLLEAMACEIPVFGTDCTALKEHIGNNERGQALPVDYVIVDPFGNGQRYFVNSKQSAQIIRDWFALDGGIDTKVIKDQLINAFNYVNERNWTEAGNTLAEAIKKHVKH